MKIGILLPRSIEHPLLAKDFYNGIKGYIQTSKISNIELVHENIGFGGIASDVLEKIESLVVVHDVKIIIGFFDLRILDKIQPYLEQNKILLLLTNAGANYPLDFTNTSKYIVHVNAQQSFACWLTGKIVARELNNSAGLVATYYDCGYLHTTALSNGLVDNGGTIVYNYINPQHYVSQFDLQPLLAKVNLLSIKNLLCVIDTNAATIFLHDIKQCNELLDLKYFVSPQFLLASNIDTVNYCGYTTWHVDLDNEGNQLLKTTIIDSAPTIYTVVGWEAMQLISFIIQHNLPYAANAFYNASFTSPRGQLIYDNESNMFYSDIYLVAKNKHEAHKKITLHNDLKKDWKKFSAYITQGAVSGWTNTYLCY